MSHNYNTHDNMIYIEPPDNPEERESEYDFDYDHECNGERELLLSDLASDNDDFSRSNDEGWYYPDEN
jgi:hypothetical protein